MNSGERAWAARARLRCSSSEEPAGTESGIARRESSAASSGAHGLAVDKVGIGLPSCRSQSKSSEQWKRFRPLSSLVDGCSGRCSPAQLGLPHFCRQANLLAGTAWALERIYPKRFSRPDVQLAQQINVGTGSPPGELIVDAKMMEQLTEGLSGAARPNTGTMIALPFSGSAPCFGGPSLLEASDLRISKAHAETKDLLFLGVDLPGLQIKTQWHADPGHVHFAWKPRSENTSISIAKAAGSSNSRSSEVDVGDARDRVANHNGHASGSRR